MGLDSWLAPRLDQRKTDHRYRARGLWQNGDTIHSQVDGQDCLSFCSNDYLGLTNHKKVVSASCRATVNHGFGSGASHLLYGHHRLHHQLEESLAAFTGRDRALLFSTGYAANLAVLQALTTRHDRIYQDRLNHASLIDGGQLSRANVLRFNHNDLTHLESLLIRDKGASGRTFIVVDGVFSMDGDIAPLSELSVLARQYNACLIVDDAHGFGVLGDQGGGCLDHFGLTQEQVPVVMGTLGKAFGSFGAFIAGSEVLIESLIQFARPYIYTTALPIPVAAASLAALSVVQDEPERRQRLHDRIEQFRRLAGQLKIPVCESFTAVQPVIIGPSSRALSIACSLKQQGFLVGCVRPPTVPEGSARLRITLSANHSREEVALFVSTLGAVLEQHS